MTRSQSLTVITGWRVEREMTVLASFLPPSRPVTFHVDFYIFFFQIIEKINEAFDAPYQ